MALTLLRGSATYTGHRFIPMKSNLIAHASLLSFLGGLLLLSSGCASSEKSGGAPIAPNWYDSAFSKDGRLVVPNVPNTAPVANP